MRKKFRKGADSLRRAPFQVLDQSILQLSLRPAHSELSLPQLALEVDNPHVPDALFQSLLFVVTPWLRWQLHSAVFDQLRDDVLLVGLPKDVLLVVEIIVLVVPVSHLHVNNWQ